MARTAVLGFPRLGPNRELKFALEDFWRGDTALADLVEAAAGIRAFNLTTARHAELDVVPVGDFAYYDHVLDAAELVGAIAPRHGGPEASGLYDHFIAACGAPHVAPLALSRWFDTSYHHLVPELGEDQGFALRAEGVSRLTDHLREASELGIDHPRPVLLGPFTLLSLCSGLAGPLQSLEPLPALVTVYRELLRALAEAGATEVQIDEPSLVLDQSQDAIEAFGAAYAELLSDSPLEVALATYFGGLDDAVLDRIRPLRLAELHVDLVTAPERLDAVLQSLPEGARLSAGVIDGRNVWAADPDRALALLDRVAAAIGAERLTIAASCSLLHAPGSAALEAGLDPELRGWLAFGQEKLAELHLLRTALDAPPAARDTLLAGARERIASRADSPLTRNDAVRARAAALTAADRVRAATVAERLAAQAERTPLPEFPTTTIGSLPRTTEIRRARTDRRGGELSDEGYIGAVHRQIDEMIEIQEMLELDVLVHGEPERFDVVEYFAQELDGFAVSEFGWVQTYGNRAVKPPILYGDVVRQRPMVVEWWRYAQSRTERPVKASVTGPVTLMARSFVRDDQPRHDTCMQIALAVRDELEDLDSAGAPIIQVDEPGFGEALPLRRTHRPEAARWASACVAVTVAVVQPRTGVHLHLCRSSPDVLGVDVDALGIDAISTEGSRSGMAALEAFGRINYSGAIAPGIVDIHARRIASAGDLERLLVAAEAVTPAARIWATPDCGLGTRAWPETIRMLTALVEAARMRRLERDSLQPATES